MAQITAYDTFSLMEWMHREVKPFAAVLGWSIEAGDYANAADETVERYGVADVSSATDIPLLRAHALVAVMDRVCRGLAVKYDVTTDGQSMSRSKMYDAAVKELERAQTRLGVVQRSRGVGASIISAPLIQKTTPYDFCWPVTSGASWWR